MLTKTWLLYWIGNCLLEKGIFLIKKKIEYLLDLLKATGKLGVKPLETLIDRGSKLITRIRIWFDLTNKIVS